MKKLQYILIFFLLLGTAMAVQPYHEVEIVDERGERVTDITSVEIYAPDTTTNAVIYSDRGEQNVITIPMTESSTNTTLVDGFMSWYGPDGYDFSITDGTNVATNAGHRTRTSSEGTLVFPSYLSSTSTTTYTDSQTATFGTGSDWVLRGGLTADTFEFVPASDNSAFNIGLSGTSYNSDVNIFVGTALGFKLDAGVPSLTWDGGAATLNHNSNYNVGLCTGTSTGAVTLGSSTAGAIVVDTTSTATMNSDGAFSITTTDASADATIDATAGSVIIDGGEAIADAVTIQAPAGGVDVTSAATFDIDVTATGGKILLNATEDAAGAISAIVNGGTSETIVLTNTQGTGTDAFNIDATAGGIDIDAELEVAINVAAAGSNLVLGSTLGSVYIEGEENAANAVLITADGGTTSGLILLNDTGTGDESILLDSDLGGITINANAGSIDIEAVGATDGDIGINAGDDMAITATGDLAIDVTGAATVKGAWYADSRVVENHSASHTLTSPTDIGTLITVDTAAVVITLPAVGAGATYTIMNIGADGTEIHVDVNAADLIAGGCGFAAALDDGDKLTNTGATADKGDYVTLSYFDATGWYITEMVGTWADGG